MADNRNQHFVPQYYFRFFSGENDCISLLLRRDGRIVKGAPIKGQSSKSYFYGDSDVEKKVTEIESKFIPTLKRVRQMDDLTGFSREDHEFLVQAMMFQRTRTLAERTNTQPIIDKLTTLLLEDAINADEIISDEFKGELKELLPYVSANPEVHQGVRMGMAVMQAHNLLDLGCILLKNRTIRPFIFGDAPVVFTNMAQKKILNRGVLGAKTPGLVAYYPIGPFEAILLVDRVIYDLKGVREGKIIVRDLRDVEQLNKLQIHSSTAAVYFHDYKYADYVRYLWEGVGADLDGARGQVIEEAGKNGEEFILSFERQLPFFPKLTFFRYSEFPANSFIYDRDDYVLNRNGIVNLTPPFERGVF